MSKVDGNCQVCGIDIILEYCCNGNMCGCLGMPINPPVCSEKCYEQYMLELPKKQKLVAIELVSPKATTQTNKTNQDPPRTREINILP